MKMSSTLVQLLQFTAIDNIAFPVAVKSDFSSCQIHEQEHHVASLEDAQLPCDGALDIYHQEAFVTKC